MRHVFWALFFFLPLELGASRLVPPDGPSSSFVSSPEVGLPYAFCAKWNPDFGFKEARCCGKTSWKYRRRGIRCNPKRAKKSFCDEMTAEQRAYRSEIESGGIPNVLDYLKKEIKRETPQAYCSPNTGFLAWGKPVIPVEKSRLVLRRPGRCVNFGTDRMVAMIEWLGERLGTEFKSPEYQGVRLLVGDISAPRGGCLVGHGGRRGHRSHKTGQDVDLGFLHAKAGKDSPKSFSRKFDSEKNWWFLKQVFQNPFACIEDVFLDRRHIWKLKREARKDPEWHRYRRLFGRVVRHVRRHRNHFHIRIGGAPTAAGCSSISLMKPEPKGRGLATIELD